MLKYKDLTDEQQLFIDYVKQGRNVLVDACIGSGKTTAIQALCMELPKTMRILYLTYNKLLKLDAKAKIKRKGCTVTNYHSFVTWQLHQNKCLAPAGTDCIKWYNEHDLPVPQYDIVIIDEYQDVDGGLAGVVQHIVDANPGIQVVMVGDMAQKIYDRTRLDAHSFANAMVGDDAVRMEFTKCFRIGHDWAEELGYAWHKTIVGVNADFRIDCMSFSEACRSMLQLEPNQILCLGRNLGGLRSALLNAIERDNPEKFNKTTVWSATTEHGQQATSPNESCAIFTTFDGCKGMERDVCFVCDWTTSYLQTRLEKPNARRDILLNIFLVAASRGKRRIIFVQDDESDADTEDSEMLTPERLSSVTASRYVDNSLNISEMFDFKYEEDVLNALSFLKRTRLDDGTDSVIDIPLHDELIDLSPCIGIWQEVMFFNDADIAGYIAMWARDNPRRPRYHKRNFSSLSMQEKVLYYVALSTGQWRYDKQVKQAFITGAQFELIRNRLMEHLSPLDHTQIPCLVPVTYRGYKIFDAIGRCDVLRDDTVWELKFVSQLEASHFLQLAMYMVALNKPKGVLWNIRTNERWSVSISNRMDFIEAVAACVTKGTYALSSEASPDSVDYFRTVSKTIHVNERVEANENVEAADSLADFGISFEPLSAMSD